jgi:hypothetical protein
MASWPSTSINESSLNFPSSMYSAQIAITFFGDKSLPVWAAGQTS